MSILLGVISHLVELISDFSLIIITSGNDIFYNSSISLLLLLFDVLFKCLCFFIDTLIDDMAIVKPTGMLAVPRIFEKMELDSSIFSKSVEI